ncbi:helix-turn-helix transcriptional regulator [Paenibacillus sp. EKM208P]|nr:helix-turn-helix transcriptional regulator [Paenibacillus sp. EKM208P]
MVNTIVNRRKELGLTQREVAEKAGITQAQVARLETSTSVPSIESESLAYKIRTLLAVPQ